MRHCRSPALTSAWPSFRLRAEGDVESGVASHKIAIEKFEKLIESFPSRAKLRVELGEAYDRLAWLIDDRELRTEMFEKAIDASLVVPSSLIPMRLTVHFT